MLRKTIKNEHTNDKIGDLSGYEYFAVTCGNIKKPKFIETKFASKFYHQYCHFCIFSAVPSRT